MHSNSCVLFYRRQSPSSLSRVVEDRLPVQEPPHLPRPPRQAREPPVVHEVRPVQRQARQAGDAGLEVVQHAIEQHPLQ